MRRAHSRVSRKTSGQDEAHLVSCLILRDHPEPSRGWSLSIKQLTRCASSCPDVFRLTLEWARSMRRAHSRVSRKTSGQDEAHLVSCLILRDQPLEGSGWELELTCLHINVAPVRASPLCTSMEWYQGRIQPWVHYVPVRIDYADVYNLLAFFDGGMNWSSHACISMSRQCERAHSAPAFAISSARSS
jgi:hypothetical protein